MKLLFEDSGLEISKLESPLFNKSKVEVYLARLDKMHPVISGNKLFKLHFFLEESLRQDRKSILTFGGAYSNHLVATAFACQSLGIPSIGIVRGEPAEMLSHTLQQCTRYGMKLHPIPRSNYLRIHSETFIEQMAAQFGDCIMIPEGGFHPMGMKGASLIMQRISEIKATHVCTAIGTATTFSGLLKNNDHHKTIVGIPVIKNMQDIEERFRKLGIRERPDNYVIFNEYHFGGYARKTDELLKFMNEFYMEHQIPTDFIYTGKLMYAVMDKIKAGYFSAGSSIICLHTGGLQGNESLQKGMLVF